MLQVCLNGSRRPHEKVPVTLSQIAEAAVEAVAAGAESVHVHPRTDLGRETLDGELVALTVEAVRRAVPGVPVGVTTREGLVRDGVERLAVVSRWPRPDDGGPVSLRGGAAGGVPGGDSEEDTSTKVAAKSCCPAHRRLAAVSSEPSS